MVVYKWTDPNGVVHFSDQPVPGAEKIVTSGSPSHGILDGPAPAAPADKPKPKPALAATRIAITSPAREQTFSGDEQVMVNLDVEPELTPGQTISWTLNGAQVSDQPPNSTHFTLSDLARGSYTLEATLTDPTSGETKSADPVTFNVLRPSVFSPRHK